MPKLVTSSHLTRPLVDINPRTNTTVMNTRDAPSSTFPPPPGHTPQGPETASWVNTPRNSVSQDSPASGDGQGNLLAGGHRSLPGSAQIETWIACGQQVRHTSSNTIDGTLTPGSWPDGVLVELNTTAAGLVSCSTCCENTVSGSRARTRVTRSPGASPSSWLSGDKPTLEQCEPETALNREVFPSRSGLA